MQNSALQVFVWGSQSHVEDNKQFYSSFSLNGTQYSLGDAVCLHPETESQPCYVGRVKACFCDLNPDATEPHCIEIRWFERLTNLDARCRGQPDKEKELVELEETDVNPIGCISCKCSVFRTRSYDEALKLSKGHDGVWFFSRGVYRQETNSLVPYADLTTGALTAVGQDGKRGARRPAAMAAPEEDVADSEDTRSAKKGRMDSMRLNNGLEGCAGLPDADVERTTGRRKANNTSFMSNAPATAFSNAGAAPLPRSCVECGATQTPQWREGPHGPKTLCNACGVRYGRQQNRAGKRCGGAGVSRAAAQQSIGKGSSAVVSATPQSQVMQHNQKSAPMAGAYSAGNKQVMRSHQERGVELGTCNQAPARPVRQAAVLAANRTAEFARTGNFPDMDEARATAVAGATSSGPSAPTPAELPVVIQPQPQQQQAQQQPQQTTSSSKAGVRRVVTPVSPGQQLATMGNGTSSGSRQLKAVADSAANRSVGSLLEVKLEAADGAQMASCHESSHNSTESAQELVVGQAGDDDEARNVGVYGDCARRLRLGREEEETGLPLVGSGDFTSVMDKDGVMMLSAKDLLMSSGDVLGLTMPMTADAVPSTTAQLQQHHLLHRTSCSTLPTATDNHNANHAASHPVGPTPTMASSNAVDLRAVVARAAMWVPSISKYTGVLSCIEDVKETLPASMVDGLMALGHAVDKAAGEAAAADAALVAVHQVLLARQEEAARARSDAISVIGRLRSMMADLVDKHPPLALHSALQPELECLTGLEELDDNMIEGCALLQPCGSPVAHMAGVLSNVGMAVDGGDDYDDVVMGGRGVHHHPIDQHSDLDDLVGSCGRQW